MFGGGSSPAASRESKDSDSKSPSPPDTAAQPGKPNASDQPSSGDKRSGNGSPPGRQETGGSADKKRRASGVQSKASSLLASAKNTLSFSGSGRHGDNSQSPLQKLGKQDPALAVPQGQQNNSAGESLPTPRSTFRVGVWEDRNKKCRRTMEDTHAFLYNFLHTPAPALEPASAKSEAAGEDDDGNGKDPSTTSASTAEPEMVETDNGYFAIFDGHAGTFAADWCGKKLHIVLEDIIRRNPNMPIPELLDQTFTSVDAQLEKLPLKNSGCTAAVAVLRWEDRVPSDRSATGSQAIAPAAAAATRARASGEGEAASENAKQPDSAVSETAVGKLKGSAFRQRVLYTANVGDARIVLCRAGKALRLSYDHKGSDENEGKRITNAGGLILNNRVNGVLAVTRALGDTYMKDLVTGHPYTTETVIHPESDEFVIVACDGLWDVCSDQEAVDLVRDKEDTTEAAKLLVDHALNRFSTDNLSCMVVRFDKLALMESQKDKDNSLGVEDAARTSKGASEADKIVRETKALLEEGQVPAASGVSAAANTASSSESNESTPTDKSKQPSTLDGALEEDAKGGESTTDSPEVDLSSKTDQKDAVEDAVKGAA